jgi:hypothetical protein
MKKGMIPALIMALVALGALPSAAQKVSKKDIAFSKTVDLIEGGNYLFTVRSVSPMSGRTIHPTTPYSMKAEGGSFKASLPYFGKAHTGAYGGYGGIEFDGVPEDVVIKKNEKKRKISVSFKMAGGNDAYNVTMDLSYEGYGSLYINCRNRQPISYYGSVVPLEKE